MNCRGLANADKRHDVLQFFKAKQFNICCLQDTHFVDSEKDKIRKDWGNDCFFSVKTSNSRGVAILFGEGLLVDVKRVKEDKDGNFVMLDMRLFDYDLTLVALYGPNIDSPGFYEKLEQNIIEFENPLTIICGDWNIVQDFELDTYNYARVNNPQAKKRVNQMKNNLDLIDPWRESHMIEKKFTWRQPTPLKLARLDFFLVSKEIMSLLDKVEIISGYRTDHSLIKMCLNLDNRKKGRGYWKFNNSLLKDEEYIEKIKMLIKENVMMYAVDKSDFQLHYNENRQFVINDQLFFDTLLMVIRGETISYSSMKKKKVIDVEKKLENDINTLEQSINTRQDKDKVLEELEYKKNSLETLRKEKMDGELLRSKLKWMEFGEKPSNFFLNLKKKKCY